MAAALVRAVVAAAATNSAASQTKVEKSNQNKDTDKKENIPPTPTTTTIKPLKRVLTAQNSPHLPSKVKRPIKTSAKFNDDANETYPFRALSTSPCDSSNCAYSAHSDDVEDTLPHNSSSFGKADISTSTTKSCELDSSNAIATDITKRIVVQPVEHNAVNDVSLGILQSKESPLFARKQQQQLSTSSIKSYSLRTQAPSYTLTQQQRASRVDRSAFEAVKMNADGSRSTANGGGGQSADTPQKRPGSMDINRNNNGYARNNGAIMTSSSVEKREHLYKILVIGELGTGKTSFIKRYVHQFFSQNYRATIGVDFALKVLHWDSNTIVRLQLWDIAGQERFGNMTRVYYKEAVGAFIVFDVTRSGTFDCVAKWKEDLDSKVQLPDGSPIPCILLANKCDQDKQGMVTSNEKMDEYVRENGFAGWFETSAKENINIDEAARALVNKILLNDKLISASDLADSERFNLNATNDQTTTDANNKCSC